MSLFAAGEQLSVADMVNKHACAHVPVAWQLLRHCLRQQRAGCKHAAAAGRQCAAARLHVPFLLAPVTPALCACMQGACVRDGRVMLVTEFLTGGDLWHALGKPSVSRPIFAWPVWGHKVALDIARGLHFLHSRARPIVHFDLVRRCLAFDALWGV